MSSADRHLVAMEFLVLGPLEVARDGVPAPVGRPMVRRLLAMLLVSANALVTADRLIDVLWPDAPPAGARGALQAHVSRLRRQLVHARAPGHAQPDLLSTASGYLLRVDPDRVDAGRFERLANAAAQDAPAAAAARLDEALSLWRGPAYAEFADESFARAEAIRLTELRLQAVEERADAYLRMGCHGEVASGLEAFVLEHPLRERSRAQLMLALYRCGRQAEALDSYRDLRRRLSEELGLEPSAALQDLERAILQQDPQLRVQSPRRSARPGPGTAARNLPVPVTSFLGREEEVPALAETLVRARVLTLTGTGGVGKTRLALHAAAAAADCYPEGVWVVELATLRDHGAVSDAVATVLGVQRRSGLTVTDSVVEALASRRLLLILDNCEHVLDAVARLVEQIARLCPQVTVLATSRHRLAVDGEQLWPVTPLPVPAAPTVPGGLPGEDTAAVQLFRDRAAAVNPSFAVTVEDACAVAEICRRLDGVPLAIELAAARIRSMDPASIARRLDERFRLLTGGRGTAERHRTLGAVVDWSYGLLDEAERRVFERLSVFAGGFTLDAAERVCAGEGVDARDVAGLVACLVDKSMVVADRRGAQMRYRMLETLRQYARERLAEQGEIGQAHRRHLDEFLGFAEQAEPHIRGTEEARWVRLLDDEFDNLRVAHGQARAWGNTDHALRLTASLYWYAHGGLRDEVFFWAEADLGLPGASGHPRFPTVCALAGAGRANRGDLEQARALGERALAAAPAEDGGARFPPLHLLVNVAIYEGRLADCLRLAQDLRDLAVDARDRYWSVFPLLQTALALTYRGDAAEALAVAAELYDEAEALGNPSLCAWARYAYAEALGDRDPEQALALLDEAAELGRSVGDRFGVGVALVTATSLRARHGGPEDALRSFHDVITHWCQVGDWTHLWPTLRHLVGLFVRLGRDRPAAVLHGAVTSPRTGAPPFGRDADELAEGRRTLEARLGGNVVAALRHRGAAMSGDSVIIFAHREIDRALEPEE